ncbi:hypothetical protein [Virgibacillus ainsalahensis]
MAFILTYQWELFIALEVLSLLALLLFGIVRYFLSRRKLSLVFILTFLVLLAVEALLALVIYQETGEISTFQIVIMIFVVYACTFGILDFKKLDRWMRKKIGQWRNVELLTEKDHRIMKRDKDPKYLAKKYRWTSIIHLIVFVVGQSALWIYGTGDLEEMFTYLRDFSWIEAGNANDSPYANETMYGIGMIWGIVFIADFIYSWSYTIFPSKPKD